MAEISWDALRSFIAVAKSGTISGASRDLGLSIAAISRRIDGLEAGLKLRLFHRGPHGASLTKDGMAVLKFAEAGAEQFVRLEQEAHARRLVEGAAPVKISATEPIIAEILAPRIHHLFVDTPGLRVEFSVSTETANLNTGDADIAIRLADPKNEAIIAVRLPSIRLGLFCSRAYLDGRDPDALDFREERLLWLDDAYGRIPENEWIREHGLSQSIVFRTSSTRALMQAAAAGNGIALASEAIAKNTGLIATTCPKLPSRHLWMLFHRTNRHSATHRAVRKWVVGSCREMFG